MHDDRTARPGAMTDGPIDLTTWAETVCDPAEIQLDPRADWALEVTERRRDP